jgi:hypothetical protein
MDRVKDITKLIMYQGSVLIRIEMKETKIISTESANNSLVNYAVVVATSPDVVDIKVGDIILDFRPAEGFLWKGSKYAILPRMSIKVAVEADNFNTGKN